MSGRFVRKAVAIALVAAASLIGSHAWSEASAELDPAIPTEGSPEVAESSAVQESTPPAVVPETAEPSAVQETAPLAADPEAVQTETAGGSASEVSAEPEYPAGHVREESDQTAEPTSVADTTKTDEASPPDTGKQDSSAEPATAARSPYSWGKRRGFRGYHRDFADRQRERRRAWLAQMKENRDRYQAARRWWSNPRSEARREWADAHRQYRRNQSELMRSQRFAYDDRMFDEVSPGMAPYGGTPYAAGPHGTPPAWGRPPRY